MGSSNHPSFPPEIVYRILDYVFRGVPSIHTQRCCEFGLRLRTDPPRILLSSFDYDFPPFRTQDVVNCSLVNRIFRGYTLAQILHRIVVTKPHQIEELQALTGPSMANGDGLSKSIPSPRLDMIKSLSFIDNAVGSHGAELAIEVPTAFIRELVSSLDEITLSASEGRAWSECSPVFRTTIELAVSSPQLKSLSIRGVYFPFASFNRVLSPNLVHLELSVGAGNEGSTTVGDIRDSYRAPWMVELGIAPPTSDTDQDMVDLTSTSNDDTHPGTSTEPIPIDFNVQVLKTDAGTSAVDAIQYLLALPGQRPFKPQFPLLETLDLEGSSLSRDPTQQFLAHLQTLKAPNLSHIRIPASAFAQDIRTAYTSLLMTPFKHVEFIQYLGAATPDTIAWALEQSQPAVLNDLETVTISFLNAPTITTTQDGHDENPDNEVLEALKYVDPLDFISAMQFAIDWWRLSDVLQADKATRFPKWHTLVLDLRKVKGLQETDTWLWMLEEQIQTWLPAIPLGELQLSILRD
ncbi:hypothetical protein CC1G_07843 [Coprinopsis cinerea okayama7|uniref:Uncharacterized protein n=1 Tax=Coprinopsis cinerea (strain Okayama-7 / 130 / ATCC MYA-4618 / FGSC 9003) TaxID=240176 RepID=A8P410_COPC7|nr:hypothetical protein CC1G_07843 [Coprinopsis cinerea okayama7\|eukprot:XP_001838652.2 hypothetical protein CC1G_07843 [Coprinopsis cinerea okayama7\